MWKWRQGLEYCKPRNAKNASYHPKLRERDIQQVHPQSPQEMPKLLTPWSPTSSLHNWDNAFLLFYATQLVVLCHGRSKKPIGHPYPKTYKALSLPLKFAANCNFVSVFSPHSFLFLTFSGGLHSREKERRGWNIWDHLTTMIGTQENGTTVEMNFWPFPSASTSGFSSSELL